MLKIYPEVPAEVIASPGLLANHFKEMMGKEQGGEFRPMFTLSARGQFRCWKQPFSCYHAGHFDAARGSTDPVFFEVEGNYSQLLGWAQWHFINGMNEFQLDGGGRLWIGRLIK